MKLQISNAEAREYAKYYSIYSGANLFASFDWHETLQVTAGRNGHFVMLGDDIVGGFTLDGNVLSFPFLVSPFANRAAFWWRVFVYAKNERGESDLAFQFIAERDEQMLINFFHAELVSAQCRMLRPTARMCPKLNDGFYFDVPLEADKAEIARTVYEAHAAGYTSTVEKADESHIAEAINRRFALFMQTNTLDMGTVAKRVGDDAIVGVCIAGIYPDSRNNFSTIHQVSVRPAFQRMGIAEAMMRNSIDKASSFSPVITLGVMIGNPAELLYRKIGFVSGARYAELRTEA